MIEDEYREKTKGACVLPGAVVAFFLINLLFWGLAWENAMGCIRIDFAEVSQNAHTAVYYFTGVPDSPFDETHRADSSIPAGKNTSVTLTGVDAKLYNRIRFDFTGQPGTEISISKITMMTSPLFEYVLSGVRLTKAFQTFSGVSVHSSENGMLTMEMSDKSVTMASDHIDLRRQWNPFGMLIAVFFEILLFGLIWCVVQNYMRKDYIPFVPVKIPEKPVLDIAKFTCAFLILALHIGPFGNLNRELDYFTAQILARIAVPLFFTISGYLFFSKLYDAKTKTFRRNDDVLNRYFSRIVGMYFAWNFFYLFVVKNQNDLADKFLWSLLVQGGFWQLWYLWTLALAVFALYHLLCRGIQLRPLLILSMVLYAIGIIFDYGYAPVIETNPLLYMLYHCYQAYFPRGGDNIFSFAFPFVCMGGLFAMRTTIKVNHALLKALAAFLFMTLEGFMASIHFNAFGTSLWIFLPLTTYFTFAWLQQQNSSGLRNTKVLREMSSVIFLIHTFFLAPLISPLRVPHFPNNKLLEYLFVSAASCVFSAAFLCVSKKFPILKRFY